MADYVPPSKGQASVIASRARLNTTDLKSVRSVRSLEKDEYCDPHDPCCIKKDPEIFLDQSILTEATRTARNKCPPKNPHHFEYTILHRLKLRRLLQAAVERQNNEALTPAELEEIRRIEEEEDMFGQFGLKSSSAAKDKSGSPVSINPETAPPPPQRRVTQDPEYLEKTLEGLINTPLAHEIALNKDFHFRKPERSDGSSLTRQMKITLDVKDKYWKKLDEILTSKEFKQWKTVIVDLFGILKTTLIGCIPPDNLQLIEKLNLELDLRKMGKQIEKDNDSFDIMHYVTLILEGLASLCCPIRDKDIIDIRVIPSLSQRIRRLLELMEAVQLDTSNFVLSQSRQHIIQNCIIFERNNFANYIDTQYWQRIDPLRVTRDWIRFHSIPDRPYNEMMANAFCEVLDWHLEAEWPESLALDWNRYIPIRMDIMRVTFLAVMMEQVHAFVDGLDNPVKRERRQSFESEQVTMLKDHRLTGLLSEALDQVLTIQDFEDPERLQEALEFCAEEVIKVVDDHSRTEYCQGISEEDKNRISDIVKSTSVDNPRRAEYMERVRVWFKECAKGEGKKKIQTPYSLRIVATLIIVPVMGMIRLMMYNRAVFDVLYREIFDGNCGPPTKYPPKSDTQAGEEVIVLDANKYGQKDEGNRELMDENIARIVETLREFNERTMVYRRSKIDPRTKPMFEADGKPILPAEMQAAYEPPKMTPLEQKHYDEKLLATEPTLDEDFQGIYGFGNVGEPDWMFGYTTEQLLQLMERENLVNANKLRRIKERLTQETLQKRVADNLPVFQKLLGKDGGTLQKEFCRLQRLLEKGPSPLPPGATDEPSGRRRFPDTCVKEVPVMEELPQYNEKGERLFYSKFGGRQFTRWNKSVVKSTSMGLDDDTVIREDELDMETITRALAQMKDQPEDPLGDPSQSQLPSQTNMDTTNWKEENALEKLIFSLSRNDPVLNILDMRIRVPRKSTRPVWARIFGTVGHSRQSIARQRYQTMMSVARHIEEHSYPSPIQPKTSPSEQVMMMRPQQVEGAKPVTISDKMTTLGRNVFRPKKSKITHMPGTSEVMMVRTQASSTVTRKPPVPGFIPTGVVKFQMATIPRPQAPPGQVRRQSRDILNRINY